jgi:hypothetical protein
MAALFEGRDEIQPANLRPVVNRLLIGLLRSGRLQGANWRFAMCTVNRLLAADH